MATAVVQEQQLLKTLRWYDGFVIALANPGFLLGSLGFSVGDLGGWGAAMLWGISAVVAVFINTIYSELATMFPEKSGGLALYAHEAWRKYTTLVGPIATFGYWIGWSVVLSVNGLFIGSIIQSTWFSGEPGGSYLADDGYFSVFGLTEFGLPAAIAIVLILGVWLFNIFGARVGVLFGYGAGVLLMVPLFVMMILPFLNGSFDSDNLTNKLNDPGLPWGGLQLALVWLWLMCWSAWGVDVCATFAPEYKDTVRDTKLALRSAALFSMVVYIMLPIAFVGGAGAEDVAEYNYAGGMMTILGSNSACAAGLPRRLPDSELPDNHEHGHRRRGTCALRHLARRHDGQAARDPEQVPGAGERDDRGHGGQHMLRTVHRQHLRRPRGAATSATCSPTCSRCRASCSSGVTGRTGRGRSSSGRSGRPSPACSPSGA